VSLRVKLASLARDTEDALNPNDLLTDPTNQTLYVTVNVGLDVTG
jgi:hypothetical protein